MSEILQRSSAFLPAAPIVRKIAGCTLAGALALFCLTSSVFLLSSQLFQLFLFDEAGYGESYIIYDILHLQNTGVIYRDLSQPPYLPAQYSPLLYILYSVPGQLVTLDNPFLGPRFLVFTAFLSCIAVVVSIVRALVPGRFAWLWGLLLAISILSFQDSGNWIIQVRADFPGILFSLLACRFLLARARYTVLLAGLCAGLAMQFKITLIAALIAGFWWLLLRKRWRELGVFVAAGLVTSAGLYAFFWSREPRMLSQMMALSPGVADLFGCFKLIFRVIREPVFLLALLGLSPLATGASPRWGLLLLFASVSFAIAAFAAIQAGANINYFFEALLALVPFAVLGVYQLRDWARQNIALAVFLAAVVLLYFIPLNVYFEFWSDNRGHEIETTNRTFRKVQNVLSGRHILSTVPRLALLDPVPVLTEPFLWAYMQRLGKFDPQPILQSLRNNEFEVVITATRDESWRGIPRVAPDLRRAIKDSYEPLCGIRGVVVYLPRWRSEDADLVQALRRNGCLPLTGAGAFGIRS